MGRFPFILISNLGTKYKKSFRMLVSCSGLKHLLGWGAFAPIYSVPTDKFSGIRKVKLVWVQILAGSLG